MNEAVVSQPASSIFPLSLGLLIVFVFDASPQWESDEPQVPERHG